MVKYYLYDVPFKTKQRLMGGKIKESSWIGGVTIASSQQDAKRRIKTAYTVSKFGRVSKRSNMTFDNPKTKGIA